jgi:hypothetical protein
MMPLLHIPVIAGLSLEVYFIVIILGIPVYFFCQWLCKKLLKENKTRKTVTWIATIIATPIVYFGLVVLFFFSSEYYPKHDFDRKEWLVNKDQRYEYSDDIIESKMLIGKTKDEVRKILGDVGNSNNENEWHYELGYRPEIGNIDPDTLVIEFKNGRVSNVEQHAG